MKLHANARLSVKGRALLVERDRGRGLVAGGGRRGRRRQRTHRAQVAGAVAGRGLAAGLSDRSSAPTVGRRIAPTRRRCSCWRHCASCGSPHPELAELLDMPVSTVSAVLKRIGMGKLGRLGLEPAQRYERERPGELIHIDVKKLGRIAWRRGKRVTGDTDQRAGPAPTQPVFGAAPAGWDAVHVAVDDATRLAYVEVLPDEKAHHRHRVPAPRDRVLRPLRHHASSASSPTTARPTAQPSHADRLPRPRHPAPTHPALPRPQTNGKAERFIRTMLGGWAYGAIYATSAERTAALDGWLWTYNHHRRHSAI